MSPYIPLGAYNISANLYFSLPFLVIYLLENTVKPYRMIAKISRTKGALTLFTSESKYENPTGVALKQLKFPSKNKSFSIDLSQTLGLTNVNHNKHDDRMQPYLTRSHANQVRVAAVGLKEF